MYFLKSYLHFLIHIWIHDCVGTYIVVGTFVVETQGYGIEDPRVEVGAKEDPASGWGVCSKGLVN